LSSLSDALARRAVERSVAGRQAAYSDELQRVVDATYRVIARTGTVDPTLRDILRESGLSTQAFYRYFTSKDELLLVLLDDGRRRLWGYLQHRMDSASDPVGRVRAWIEGVLAQAADPDAAARTRPFVANEDRLAEAFPAEHEASFELLFGLLADSVGRLPGRPVPPRGSAGPRPKAGADGRRDAEAVYRLTFATLHAHLLRRTVPSSDEVDHLVRFCLRALQATA
jgi:AcrR family transcriptional regulator